MSRMKPKESLPQDRPGARSGLALPRERVLFVCIGNSCRSQMAEGFARAYGSDVIDAASAGLAPALAVSALTRKVMLERGIDLAQAWPKPLAVHVSTSWDIIVNLSGESLPGGVRGAVREWKIEDPIGGPESLYQRVADEIETLVMALILERRAALGGAVRGGAGPP